MKATTAANKAEGALAENVGEPLRRAIRTAASRVDALAAETKEVAGKVETQVMKATAGVRAKGREIAKDPRKFVDTVVKTSRRRAEKVTNGFSKEAKRISDDVTKRVSSALESAVEKTLHRFNVPTHKELQKLTSKVDTLGAKIDSMRRTKSPARAKAARKAAPKRARARR
ncbi:MAG TPA: phasin family protein [Thermoanaerobaculia bacterium]|nr:phasin family protein [Thermoanaerobaculia bacterium]